MNEKEAAKLLGYCAAFDNRKPSTAAAIAWSSALHDVPLDADCKAAVDAYYTTPPKDPDAKLWILPHNVRTLRSKLRDKRLENFQYEPIAGESTAEYLARYRGQVRAIASGQVPAPTERPMLKGGADRFVRELEARGWQGLGPEAKGKDASSSELIDTVRRSGPLGIVCPTCRAAIGRPCKTPGATEKQLGKPRSKPHNARLRAVSGRPDASPEQRAAEEQRVREASARHLARQADLEAVHDAEIVEEAS